MSKKWQKVFAYTCLFYGQVCIIFLLNPYLIIWPRSLKLLGTQAPAAFRAAFLAVAVSLSALADAPACPNCTCIYGNTLFNYYIRTETLTVVTI